MFVPDRAHEGEEDLERCQITASAKNYSALLRKKPKCVLIGTFNMENISKEFATETGIMLCQDPISYLLL